MLDLTTVLDSQTEFPSTWKTLVRELLLKFEDGGTYHHESIVGNRPFQVDLKITIDEPVDDKTYYELHEQRKTYEQANELFNNFLESFYNLINDNDLDIQESMNIMLNALKKSTIEKQTVM